MKKIIFIFTILFLSIELCHAANYFTLGSTMEEVKAVQGNPSSINTYEGYMIVWYYKYSTVGFDYNTKVVVEYDESTSGDDLKVFIGDITEGSIFNIGSSQGQVIKAQGTPTGVKVYEGYMIVWYYKYSTIGFDYDTKAVIEYDESTSGNDLKVDMGNKILGSYFDIGSSQEQVIKAQGTPTGVKVYEGYMIVWYYKYSTVGFNHDTKAVIEYDESTSGDKLNIGQPQEIKSITLTSPNGGESWTAGSTKSITWTSTGVSFVKLEYSTNNGINWTLILATFAGSNGVYSWTVPNVNSKSCTIRITSTSNSQIIDISDTVFTIIPAPEISIVTPNDREILSGGSIKVITWTAVNVVDNIKIEYTADNGWSWKLIATGLSVLSGNYSWTVPNIQSGSCRIRITSEVNNSISDQSFGMFSILPVPSIIITSPSGGEILTSGTSINIVWSSFFVSDIKLEYSSDNGSTWTTIVGNVSATTEFYSWTVPNINSTNCIIKISDVSDSSINDMSDAVFTIVIPQITITSPNGGEIWVANSQKSLTWTSIGVNKVKIEYSTDSGTIWTQYDTEVTAISGTYSMILPNISSLSCLIRISDTKNNNVFDKSDTVFTIIKKEIKVISPNGGETYLYGTSVSINWTFTAIDKIKFEYSGDNGATWIQVDTDITASLESYSWDIPNIKSSQCLIRLSDAENPAVNDISDAVFTMTPPFITIITPNGSEKWPGNSAQNITWTSIGVENLIISYSYDNGLTWTIIENVSASKETYSWSLPNISSDNCIVKISDSVNSDIWDQSDAVFSMTMPEINLPVTSINFGTLPVGEEKAETFTIENTGNGVLSVENIVCNNNNFTVALSSINIEPQQSQVFTVKFKPLEQGIISGIITVLNDDSDENSVTVSVTGTAYTPCSVAVDVPDGEISSDAVINYTITNPDNDEVNLVCEFSTDNGLTWRNAAVEGKTSGINPDGYNGFFVWKGKTDLPGYDGKVKLRVTPSNIMEGLPEIKEMTVDFNETPSIVINQPDGDLTGDISISYNLSDAENDTINILFEYSMDSNIFRKTKNSGLTGVLPGNSKNVVWDSFADAGYVYQRDVYFRMTPADKDSGESVTAGPFKITNLVADYNRDLKINGDDLLAFSDAWNSKGITNEIGPADGNPPDLSVKPDGKFDSEDLMVFLWMWHWDNDSGTTGKIADYKAYGNSHPLIFRYNAEGALNVLCDEKADFIDIFVQTENGKNGTVSISGTDYWDKNGRSVVLKSGGMGIAGLSAVFLDKGSIAAEKPYNLATISLKEKTDIENLNIFYKLRYTGSKEFVSGKEVISKDEMEATVSEINLYQNSPNPFNPTTTIEYSVLKDTTLRLIIYNSSGQEVAILKDGVSKAGRYSVVWDANGMPSGIYFYKLITGKKTETRKMILMK